MGKAETSRMRETLLPPFLLPPSAFLFLPLRLCVKVPLFSKYFPPF